VSDHQSKAVRDSGPAGFTFAEVARWAGVSPAALYRHFRDRDELLTNVPEELLLLTMSSSSLILGINAYHADAAACIVRDGQLLAAAEEERFRRIKHWAGFPSQAISYCLREANADLKDVTEVAVNRNSRANFFRKFSYVLLKRPNPRLVLARLRNRNQVGRIGDELHALAGRPFAGAIDHVEHHFAHLASTFYPSPFNEALILSIDGFGDFASAAWGHGAGTSLSLDGRILFPHSLGIFYQAMTQYLGFTNYGDEYKLMGLAACGDSSSRRDVEKLLSLHNDGTFALDLNYFRHHMEDIAYEWSGGEPVCGPDAMYRLCFKLSAGPDSSGEPC
jgi:carbamoyltransferase